MGAEPSEPRRSRSTPSGPAGARTQLSGLTAAALTVLTLLFLTVLSTRLPEAALSAVVELARSLDADGSDLVVARDVGQVRDVLHATSSDGLRVVPDLDRAVAELAAATREPTEDTHG